MQVNEILPKLSEAFQAISEREKNLESEIGQLL
jgi:hypothetical protein